MTRPDFSGFELKLDAAPATDEALAVEQAAAGMGGMLWSPFGNDKYRPSDADMLGRLRDGIARAGGFEARDPQSVALVDWTSLRHTRELFEGPHHAQDPFTALGDFGAVVAALLFYDRVLTLPDTERLNELFGLDDVVRSLSPTQDGQTDSRFHDLLDSHYHWALATLDGASTDARPPKWFTYLEENWRTLFPEHQFPSHTIEDGFEPILGYNASPDNKSYLSVAFTEDPGMWDVSGRLPEVILDNDIRALFYERLASTLQALIAAGQYKPEVRYVGGCLRSPLIRARARDAEERLESAQSPEDWLMAAWRSLYVERHLDVKAPFWLQAVLSNSKSPEEVCRKVRAFRQQGRPFRSHRQQYAEAVAAGDSDELKPLMQAMAGDLKILTKNVSDVAGAGVEAATAVLSVTAPVVPTELVKAAAAAAGSQSGWLRKMGLRLFRPRLFFIVNLAGAADRGTKVLHNAVRLFDFDTRPSERPQRFLEAMSRTTWVA